MKKEYQKPMLLIENFSLSENIASECTIHNYNHYKMSCEYEDGATGGIYFWVSTCKDDEDPDDEVDYFPVPDGANLTLSCTNGPISAGFVFNS